MAPPLRIHRYAPTSIARLSEQNVTAFIFTILIINLSRGGSRSNPRRGLLPRRRWSGGTTVFAPSTKIRIAH